MAWSSDLFLNHGRLAVVATSTMDATSKFQPVPKVPNFLHTSSSSHKLGQVLQNQLIFNFGTCKFWPTWPSC